MFLPPQPPWLSEELGAKGPLIFTQRGLPESVCVLCLLSPRPALEEALGLRWRKRQPVCRGACRPLGGRIKQGLWTGLHWALSHLTFLLIPTCPASGPFQVCHEPQLERGGAGKTDRAPTSPAPPGSGPASSPAAPPPPAQREARRGSGAAGHAPGRRADSF